jgi:hypothetical protein
MSAPTAKSTASGDAQEAAEAITILDALARALAAAALVVAALDRLEDRRALRLVCTQLRDAVGEATTKLEVRFEAAAVFEAARPPTPARWPRLEALTVMHPDAGIGYAQGLDETPTKSSVNRLWCDTTYSAALEAIGAESWGGLRTLTNLGNLNSPRIMDVPAARALAAALRQMPCCTRSCSGTCASRTRRRPSRSALRAGRTRPCCAGSPSSAQTSRLQWCARSQRLYAFFHFKAVLVRGCIS